jgi:Ca2+-binding RTX toxin-like protein
MATWASVKRQSRTLLGINLKDPDLLDVPMLATDPYGEFIPGPHGLPQLVRKGPDGKPNTADDTLLEGSLTSPVDVPSDVVHFDTPFVGDIAHNADPSPRSNPGGPPTILTPDADHVVNDPQRPLPADPDGSTNHYDDELLDTHFCAGDGRVNENIALSAVHQIFHSEHDRLVDDIKHTLSTDPDSAADLHAFWQPTDPTPANGPNVAVDGDGWAGDRLFQAARFVTEMEYQHLVFEEFARKIQPNIRLFHVYHSDMNPVIPAEFAHAVYRFGHSMLDDDVARTTVDATGKTVDHSVPLLKGFLNPPEYFNSGDPANPWNASQAAGAIIMGSTDQVGNELDEFVTETLRNNLLGLPLDLPTINMTRAREAGVPSLNNLRREIHDKTNDAQLAPYTDWSDYGQHLKHPESLINYVAAYGEHPSIRDSGPDGILKDDPATGVDESADNVLTVKAKRLAATAIVDPSQLPAGSNVPIPTDAADFMFSTGFWATHETGLNNVDLWVGGLGEVTNLFGGLLGSTFNYVFQNTLENLQDGDRLYYLNRTPGMNLRTQLEGNSFAELAERNTDGTNSLKADVFATSDCEFQLSALKGTPEGFGTDGSTVADDPNTECDETALLLRKPDGTIQYRARNSVNPSGINGQSTYNGTDVVDRIFGGNDNDTLWGNGGDDILEGNGGDDNTLGGDGNDIITDLDGADVLKGGDGNDAIDGGPGDDIIMSGNGSDFTNGGSFDNETFGGPGNDFIQLGQGADAAFGDSGDDWMQGGSGQDLIQGDHGAPFFDDPAESHPGNDVMVGQVGENDYDTEGGDDLMSQNSAIDRNAGAGGFDWAFHQYDTVGADDDMAINNNLLGLNLPLVVNRDRWQETEGDSGSPFNDVIKGDDETPAGVGGAGFTGCDALDQDGLNRITGLAELVPSLTADPAPTGVVSAASVATASATGTCPLSGNVWGDGNILLGGGGGDTIEGRGGNDIIDGDRALHARLSVRTDPANPDTELGTTDLMEGKPLNHDLTPNPTGNFGPGTDGMTLQQAVFAGKVDPGKIVMVREIVTEPSTGAANDVAVFSGPQTDYDITQRDDGSVTVAHTRGAATDGTDTLRNIETLRFGGLTGTDVPLAPSAALTANTSADFGSVVAGAAAGSTRTFTLTNSGLNPLTLPATGKFAIAPGTDASLFTVGATTCGTTLAANGGTCTVQVTFRPTAATATGTKSATLVATNNSGGVDGSTQTIALTGAVTAAPPANRPATGVPTISDTTPQIGQQLTALTGNINDPDGLRTPPGFTFEWQASLLPAGNAGFLPIPNATQSTFTVPNNVAASLLRYRVVVRFTDAAGHAESVTSAPTARPTTGPNTTGLTAPATAPLVTSLGQALAPPQAPAPLRASTLSVSARPAAPLAVVTTVPKGASTVQITLFRLNAPATSTKNRKVRSTSVHIATVYRKTTKAKRYVFRLTEKRFRNLKPGRYLIQVRVGSSRTSLGPAMSRQIMITGTRSKTAR